MSHREMKEELTCPICMELFRQPRRLPCGHSYCHVCIKAMLDRRAEESGLYLNYSRPLICPECREEVNVDFVKGIEGIPPDFKLTKLVDLFQFMKGNNDSDSGDELQPYQSVPCAVITEPSRTDTTAAAAFASLPPVATTPSEETRAPLFPQPTNPPSTSTTPASQPLEQVNQTAPESEHNSNPSDNTAHPLPTTLSSINSPVSVDSRQLNQTDHHLREVTSQAVPTTNAQRVDTGISFSHLLHHSETQQVTQPPSDTPTSPSDDTNPPLTQSNTVSSSSPTDAASRQSGSQNNLHTVTGSTRVSDSNRLSQNLNKDNAQGEIFSGRDLNTQGSSRPNESRSNDNLPGTLDAHGSPLGAVGGAHSQSQVLPKNHSVRNPHEVPENLPRNLATNSDVLSWHEGLDRDLRNNTVRFGQRHQNVDEIVSFPFSSSERTRNLSQSSVSLPTEVKENVSSGQQGEPAVGAHSAESDRISRAHSVPTETGEDRERTEVKQKPRKERRRGQSASSDSDSSSDFFRRERRKEGKKSTKKQKRWLMTRFLRSVIFSDSSSTDYSDDDDVNENFGSESRLNNRACASNTTEATRRRSLNESQQSRLASVPKKEANSRQNHSGGDTGNKKSGGAGDISRQPCDNSQSEGTQACYLSLDSNTRFKEPSSLGATSTSSETSPKEKLNSSSSPNTRQVNLSGDSATSLSISNIPRGAKLPQGDTNVKRGNAVPPDSTYRALNEPLRNLPVDAAFTTFYDNLNSHISPSSDNECRTRYDNVATRPHRSVSAEFVDADSVRCDNILVRNPGFDPCNQTNRQTDGQRRGYRGLSTPDLSNYQGRTLYDNIDDCDLMLEGGLPISPRIPRRYVRDRNPVTEIEDLKTGYEHMDRNGRAPVREDVNRDLCGVEHMGELDLETRQTTSTQDSSLSYAPYNNDSLNQLAYEHEGHSERLEVGAQVSRDNPSSYDNFNVSDSFTDRSLPPLSGPPNVEISEMAGDNVAMTATQLERPGEEFSNRVADIGGSDSNEYPDNQRECNNEELDFVENYFDPNSEQLRRRNMSLENLAPAAVALEAGGINQSERKDERVEETDMAGVSSPSTSSASVARGSNQSSVSSRSGNNENARKKETSSDNEDDEDEDDDGSHSGTSMLQNKKKPRSRLKKFLTSLLSLSSSSEDEDNYDTRTSSSKSSDW